MTVSVEDMKAHLNVTGDEDDAIIASKLAATEMYIDAFLDRKFADYQVDDEDAPEIIKQAVMMITAHLYECREHVLVGVNAQVLPLDALDLIGSYRRWAF